MKKYLPATIEESEWFESRWCAKCNRCPKSVQAKNQCRHMMIGMAGDENGKWFIDEFGSPFCSAFKSRADANKNRLTRKKNKNNQMQMFV